MTDTTYQNVADMVRDLTGDTELVEATEHALKRQHIIRQLMAARASKDLSQADVGEKVGCSQSRISKLEGSSDDDLKYGELRKYADAVGCELRVGLHPKDLTPADEVKCLALAVSDRLARMADLAQCDEEIAEGVAGFLGEVFLNFSLIVGRAAASLPCCDDGTPRVGFRVELTSLPKRDDNVCESQESASDDKPVTT